jgi:hypothetical protein
VSRQISLPGPSILPETHFQTGSKNPAPLRLTPDLHLADHAVFVVHLQILFGPADLAFQLSLSKRAPQTLSPGIQPEPGSFGPNVRFSKGVLPQKL